MFKTTLLLVIWPGIIMAACFSFDKPITKLVHSPIKITKETPSTQWRKLPKDILWSAARAIIKNPISHVLEVYLDPMTVRNKDNTELEVKKRTTPHFFAIYDIVVDVHLALFFSIDWNEQWGYALLKGSRKNPEKVLISYQYTGGTNYIDHKCGQILITKVDANSTDVFQYETVKASRWNEEKAINHHKGTLKKLAPKNQSQ